ncbi:hypothetical protein GE061_010489 [Apolygus lucorum]|uniref:Peptidase M13 C-terminal domain-containing protein n=1 Tax=Apolygus lucorum TaxID=248454 RepID=A0A8S9XUS6_APOLU|nr:hypothetical protein GE061_010489 [Apolygus lucorum]
MGASSAINYAVLLLLISTNVSASDPPSTDKNLVPRDVGNAQYPKPGDSDTRSGRSLNFSNLPDDDDEIKGFAVFVDSPDPEEASSSVEEQYAELGVNDTHEEYGDDLIAETSMREISSKKVQNGSVIHDIRIVVKHPQNFKGKNRPKGVGRRKIHKKKSRPRGNVKTSPNPTAIYNKMGRKKHSTLPSFNPIKISGNCGNASCPGQPAENSEVDPVVYSQRQWSVLTGEMRYVNLTVNSTGINSVSDLNNTRPGSNNLTGQELAPNKTVQQSTTQGKCANTIYLNLTDSDTCVSQCLISCITLKNRPPVVHESLNGPKQNYNASRNSSSEDSITTHFAGVKENTTKRTGYKLNTNHINVKVFGDVNSTTANTSFVPRRHKPKIIHSNRSPKHKTPKQTTKFVQEKNASAHENRPKGNSTEINFAGVTKKITELDGIKLDSNPTSTEIVTEKEGNLHVLVGSEIKHNLLETPAVKKSDHVLKDICLTETCVLKAADFLKRMNASADPCVNFYEFACGRFLKRELPDGIRKWSVLLEITNDILHKVGSVLKHPVKTSDPSYVIELKRFYDVCLKNSHTSLIQEFMEELGGWPDPQNPSWKMPKRSWQDIVLNWTHGDLIEYNFVELDLTNSTDQLWGLSVELPSFVREALKNGPEILRLMENVIEGLAKIFLKVDDASVNNSIRILRLFMEYAVNYANITRESQKVSFHTLGELKHKFPHLTLFKSLPSLLENLAGVKIDDKEVIAVANLLYLQKVDTLIRDTPVKTQIALLVMHSLRKLYTFLLPSRDNSPHIYCTELTWDLYPNIVDSIYSSNFVDDKRVKGVTKILSQVKNSLEKALKDGTLEDKIASIALKRLNTLTFIMSLQNRQDRGFGITGLTELVDKVNVSFALMVKAGIGNYRRGLFEFMNTPYNSSLPYIIYNYFGHKYHVNAYTAYSYVFIPFNVMHDNIYNEDLPSYVNFAGVGFVLGHEMVHGVKRDGLFQNATRYSIEEQCLVDQFSDFTERYLGLPLNGKQTKDENVADLGGLREAYLAYTNWARHHMEDEVRLPGLHRFNNRQMFWLTLASNWCLAASRESRADALDDVHAPPENRVNGGLANLPEFSRDFHCPLNSPMNPSEKCSLWWPKSRQLS